VTGEHKILKKNDFGEKLNDIFKNYITVSSYDQAEKTDNYDKELFCLITSNHRIPVGEYTFWDWED
ncbi:unnamed protein product, partial [marine sediment metagenome]